jgi:hypothetical protein
LVRLTEANKIIPFLGNVHLVTTLEIRFQSVIKGTQSIAVLIHANGILIEPLDESAIRHEESSIWLRNDHVVFFSQLWSPVVIIFVVPVSLPLMFITPRVSHLQNLI